MKKVAVIMGSDSDLPVVEKAIDTLREFKHYDDDFYSHEIQIEIVSGDVRISVE